MKKITGSLLVAFSALAVCSQSLADVKGLSSQVESCQRKNVKLSINESNGLLQATLTVDKSVSTTLVIQATVAANRSGYVGGDLQITMSKDGSRANVKVLDSSSLNGLPKVKAQFRNLKCDVSLN